eukprot:gene7896-8711_t
MVKTGIDSSALLKKLLKSQIEADKAAAAAASIEDSQPETSAPPPPPPSDQVEGTDAGGKEDSAAVSSRQKAAVCESVNCRRRAPVGCVHRMCFLCCFDACKADGLACEEHMPQARQREEENRIIQESLMAPRRSTRLYHFRENRFTGTGQTVVIFCLHDFLANPKWHKDVFETETRKLRQRKSLKRRAVLREEWLEGKASDAAKEDCVVMEDSAGEAQAMICCRGRRAAGLRYAKVRQLWEGRVGEAQDCSWLTSTASANLS